MRIAIGSATSGHPPSVCVGWPASNSAVINNTNYSNPDLPNLLTFLNGTIVTEPGLLWEARKKEIKYLLHKYFYGTLPAENPPLVGSLEHQENFTRGGSRHDVTLTFLVLGKTNVSFDIEILRPHSKSQNGIKHAGDEKLPLFLTQSNHRRWALKAVARGYVAVVYPGADVNDQSTRFRFAIHACPTPNFSYATNVGPDPNSKYKHAF